jgi:signal transduction histidine kinase
MPAPKQGAESLIANTLAHGHPVAPPIDVGAHHDATFGLVGVGTAPMMPMMVPVIVRMVGSPFSVNGKAVGTIWAIAHDNRRKFDTEDLRLLESMSRFASVAYQSVQSIADLKLEVAARKQAESELRALTDILEAQVEARTEDLNQRNRQLAQAKIQLAEEKQWLERSELYMAEAQRLSHTGSWHLNVRTGKVVWSKEAFAILGFDPTSTRASYALFIDRVHPEDRRNFHQVQSAAVEEKKGFELEFRLLLPGGLTKHVHGIGHCLEGDSGNIEYIGALMDITERKLAQDRLRRSEAFLAEGQRLSRTGSFAWRVATDEIMWSEQLYRIFELDQSVPVTLELILSRVHPEDMSLVSEMTNIAHGGISDFAYEHRLLMPDYSVKYLHLIAHGTRDEEGRLEYIGAVQDVTQRRLSEEALGKARSDLARVARATTLGQLAASIAHEINQPLSGILTNAGTCLRMLAADSPNIDGACQTARRTIRDANRASEVITRLRALFAKRGMTIEPVDLNETAQEVIALVLSALQKNRVIIRTELGRDLPLVAGDRVQLQQVIMNLLANASDAMSGVDDRPRQLMIRTEPDEGDYVRLSVEDAGVGLEALDVSSLFEPFYSTKRDGMGIGLSVSRSIIENHGGRLWAAPNDGQGTTFSFSIPSARVTSARTLAPFARVQPASVHPS